MSGKANWPEGVARRLLDTVDSTNAEAFRAAPHLTGPCWFVAGEQTAGRGRRARAWTSPRGNFHGTLLLHPTEPAATVALRSFAAALALRDAFVALTGLPDAFKLKWPNDVLLNGGKVAGILLESSGAGQGVQHLAIGIGVNLIAAPEATQVEQGALRPVSLLEETGLRIAPEVFLDALAPAYARWEAIFAAEGFAPLRAAWLAHAARLGETIRARTGTETREGRFETIDETGALILRQSHGPVAIPAAEVFF
ncbi:biotin--[acetyl-CoA-carboxylase] ligase [Paragemmobacter ruber]|uniref:biotin--[biotin carboxyl-carrier protein] ligase n=1 Tax=Paragemmobacter ruber TaxID=1985673 RepID=A0ABW9Y8P6_9RHOB|nr:biotin--[acetyl-CoA-carboxylase] ligase [Rhodobacter ruber]NBE08972.1 biotin--[acetyl-CoA-carboxylase] ligase [Rhodobacter ruber]